TSAGPVAAESRSAALRRVTAERDDAVALRTRFEDECDELHGALDDAHNTIAVRQGQLAERTRERDLARADLVRIREQVNKRADELRCRDASEPCSCGQLRINPDTATPEEMRAELRSLDLRLRWALTHFDDQTTVGLLA